MHKLSALTVALISAHSVLASAPSFTGLGDFAGGTFQSVASSVSADGSVVVGWGNSATGQEAFRWTRESGLVGIGDLPGGAFPANDDCRAFHKILVVIANDSVRPHHREFPWNPAALRKWFAVLQRRDLIERNPIKPRFKLN